MELTTVHTFEEATKMLILTNEEINEVINLYRRELTRRTEEDAMIARSQARQLEVLMDGAFATSQEAFFTSLDESLFTDPQEPAMLIINKADIAYARSFLKSIKLKECADRLWRYEGVATSPFVLNTLGSQIDELSNVINPISVGEGRLATWACDVTGHDDRGGGKRKKSLSNPGMALLSNTRQTARPREGSLLLKLRVPSGLRNSISGDSFEETVASGPAALQDSFSAHGRTAASPRCSQKLAKKPGVPHIKFVKKHLIKSSTSESSRWSYDPVLLTPKRPILRGNDMDSNLGLHTIASTHVKSRLSGCEEPHTPRPDSSKTTPFPQEKPSRAPKLRLTHSKVELGQVENFPSTKATTTTESITLGRANTISKVSPMGVSLEMMREETMYVLRPAGAEPTRVKDYTEIKAQGVANAAHEQGNKLGQETMSATLSQQERFKAPVNRTKRKREV